MEERVKIIGIIGGMSAESTALYYRRLNEEARRRLGGLHSAECVVWSVDFARIEPLMVQGDWERIGSELGRIAAALERAGAEVLILATNTMHKVADAVRRATRLPLIHIAEATAGRIVAAGLRRPGLLATAYTMEQDFYVDALRAAGLEPVIPGAQDRAETHRIIFEELCRGVVREESRGAYEAIAGRLIEAGADCLILGCTEVGLLLDETNVAAPVFDTTLIHADVALDAALAP
jgi:aspartate racemase